MGRKRISEVSIVSTGQYNGNFSGRCPHPSGSSLECGWFEHLLAELLAQSGGRVKIPLDTAGREFMLVNKNLISSIGITLT